MGEQENKAAEAEISEKMTDTFDSSETENVTETENASETENATKAENATETVTVSEPLNGEEAANEGAVPGKKEMSPLMKKLAGGVITTWLMGYALMMLGSIVGAIIIQVPLQALGLLTDEHPVIITAVTYLEFIGIWGALIVFIIGFKGEMPFLRRIIGKVSVKAVIGWILGLVLVGGLNMLCIFFAKNNGDIYLSFGSFEIIPLVFLFICVFIQSGAEELICRGFIYRRIENTYNPVMAMIFNSMLFAIIHLMNPGVTPLSILNVFIVGVLFSLVVYYTDSMAFAMAGHAGWNFSQSIIFGLPNSGQVFPYSLYKLDASTARDSFFYNVGFGVEGTAFSLIVLVAACVIVIVLGQLKILKKPEVIKPLI